MSEAFDRENRRGQNQHPTTMVATPSCGLFMLRFQIVAESVIEIVDRLEPIFISKR
jgi:hypothetical protein